MPQCTLDIGHQHTVSPMRANREVGYEVVSGIEQITFSSWWQTRRGEALALNPHEEMTINNAVPCLMRPLTVLVPVPPGYGFNGNTMLGRLRMVSHDELVKAERKCSTRR